MVTMDSITMGRDQQMQLHPQMLSHPTFMDTIHTLMDTTMDTITMERDQLTQHHPQMLNQATFMDTTHTMDTIMVRDQQRLPHHMDITTMVIIMVIITVT